MSNQLRFYKQRIQQQADKIKELEADYHDEFVKGQMKTAEIERLKKLLETKKQD
jgi:hypothetical protein